MTLPPDPLGASERDARLVSKLELEAVKQRLGVRRLTVLRSLETSDERAPVSGERDSACYTAPIP